MAKFKTAVSLYDPTGDVNDRTNFDVGDDVPEWAFALPQGIDHLIEKEEGDETSAADPHDAYDELTKDDLVELLKDRGLATTGNKGELVERLRADDAATA